MTPRWGNGPPAPGTDTGGPPRPGPVAAGWPYAAAVPRRRDAPLSPERGVLSSGRIHPPLWPLFTARTTPVLSVVRLARRAARRHGGGQGLVVAFDGEPGTHLTVTVNGTEAVRMVGRRDRPWFVALARRPWTVRATAGPVVDGEPRARCEVSIPAPRARQIDLLRFRFDGEQLRCEVFSLRPGAPT